MRHDDKSPYVRIDRPLLATIGLVALIVTLLPAAQDRNAEWRAYQRDFRRLIADKYGNAQASQVPSGIQQIWIPELQRVDRCVTCHQGVAWKGLEKAPQPFRTHPKGPLVAHPIEKFGCTVCHGGQGHAVGVHDGHGEGHDWDEPLLGSRLAGRYSLVGVNRNALIEINCNACHRYDKETAGAGAINLAKKTFNDQPCADCHLLHGKGGTIGPDLTYVGDKPAEELDFTRIAGRKTAFNWHVAHLKNPEKIVAGTAMPDLALTDEQTQSLALLLLSWRKTNLPATYRPEVRRAMTNRAGGP